MLGLALAMMPISDKCQSGASSSAIVRAHEIVTVTVASSRAVTEEEETVESIGTMRLNYLNEGYLQEPEVSDAHCCTLQSMMPSQTTYLQYRKRQKSMHSLSNQAKLSTA